MRHFYEILGLSPGASPVEVKQAYRDMIRVWHPDRYYHDPRLQVKVQERLKEIIEAYESIRKYHISYAKESQEEQRRDYQSEQNSPDGCRRQKPKYEESKPAKRSSTFFKNSWTFLIILAILILMLVGDFSEMTHPKPFANIICSSLIPGELKPILTPADNDKLASKEKELVTIDTIKTNRGELSITKGILFEYRIRLNGDIIFQEKNKRTLRFHIHFRNIDNNEAIIVQESSGARAWFRLIMLKSDGTINITDSFGNGSDLLDIKHQGKRISFSFPDSKGSLFRSEFWLFENGRLLKKRGKETSLIKKLSKHKGVIGKPKSFSTVLKRSGKTDGEKVTK